MIRDILSIRKGECRFCVTDDTPFWFCAEPVQANSLYCAPHHKICHNGFGKDVRALEQTLVTSEWSVVYTTRGRLRGDCTVRKSDSANLQESPVTIPVDVQMRGRV